jgi:hypothetical protein
MRNHNYFLFFSTGSNSGGSFNILSGGVSNESRPVTMLFDQSVPIRRSKGNVGLMARKMQEHRIRTL